MRIIKAEATGLHNRLDIKADLAPVTVVTGPNGSGKSALLGLSALVLEGPTGPTYPVLGPSPGYDWAASVTFEADRPLKIVRWMKDGEHRLVLNREKGTLRNMESQIAARLGAAAAWRVENLLAMTPAKRQDWLVSQSILVGDLESPERVRAFWARLDALGIDSDVIEVLQLSERPSVLSVLADLRTLVQEANAEALALRDGGTAELPPTDLPPGTVASWRARIAEIDVEIGRQLEERGRRAGHGQARADLEASEREVSSEMARIKTDAGPQAVEDAERCLAEAVRAEAAAGVEDFRVASAIQDSTVQAALTARIEAEQRVREAERLVHENAALVELTGGELSRVALRVDRTTGHFSTITPGDRVRNRRDALNQIYLTPAQMEEFRREFQKMTEPARVPVLVSEGHYPVLQMEVLPAPDTIDVHTVFDTERWALYALDSAVTLVPRLARAITEGTAPRLDRDADNADLTRAREGLTRATMQHQAAERGQSRAREALTTAINAHARAVSAVTRAQEALATARAKRAAAADREGVLHQRLLEIQEQLNALLDGAVDEIEAQLSELQTERAEAQRNADRLSDEASRAATRLEREAKRAAEVARRTRGRELLKVVEQIQGKLLQEATAPLEAPASEITRRVLGADIKVALDKGASFWLHFPGHVAPVRASRSEAAVAAVALRCAIVNRLGGYRAVVLDDMENLEGGRRGLLLHAMSVEVSAGRLDNFLGAYVLDGWTPAGDVCHLLDTRDAVSPAVRRPTLKEQ